MTRRIIAILVSVTVVVLVALEVPLAVTFRNQRVTEATTELERDAFAIGDLVEDDLERGASDGLQPVAEAYQDERDARVVIVDAAGIGLADSEPTAEVGPSEGRSFAARPEIAEALAGRTVVVTRRSETLDETLLVVAVPVRSGGRVLGAIRVSRPRSELDNEVRRYQLTLAGTAVAMLAAAVALGFAVGRWATGALAGLQSVAARLERGELDSRAPTEIGPPEVRDLSARFNAMADRLSSLVRSSQDFAADASHQLRTPLTAVRLRLENLAATTSDEAAIDAVLHDVDRLDRTIDALLAFTRLDRQPTQPEVIEVGPALTARAATWAPAAAEAGVEVVATDNEARAALIEFDPNHLEQILDNLIANALDAVPAGSSIELWATWAGSLVEVHVTDHGPGLAEVDRARAFDRHWGRRTDGTGLGLAIVQRLTGNNHGTVRLDETPGGGLDVVLAAPRAAAVRAEAAP